MDHNPYLGISIDLTDTSIKEDDIFIFRSRYPEINFDFFPIYSGFKDIFENELYSDLTFLVENRKILSHRFLFSAFENVPKVVLENPKPLNIAIKGLGYDEFRQILERVYTGKVSQEDLLKLQQEYFIGNYDPYFFRKLYNNPLFSDFIVKVNGCQFHCHRAILGSMSSYFKAVLRNSMLESISKEIFLPDLNKEECSWILQNLYLREKNLPSDSQALGFFEKIEPFFSTHLTNTWQYQCCKRQLFKENHLELAQKRNLTFLLDYYLNKIQINAHFKSIVGLNAKSFSVTIDSDFVNSSNNMPRRFASQVHEITLDGHLEEGEWEKMTKKLCQFPKLEIFNNSPDYLISLEEAKMLQSLCPNVRFKKVNLGKSHTVIDVKSLILFLKANRGIEELYIEACVKKLNMDFFNSIMARKYLKKLFIRSDLIDLKMTKSELLSLIRSKKSPFETLHIQSFQHLVQFGTTTLKISSSSNCNWKSTFDLFPVIKMIEFRIFVLETPFPIKIFITLLKQYPSLKCLKFVSFSLTDEYLQAIGDHSPQIEKLHFSSNPISVFSLKELMVKCTELKVLELHSSLKLADYDLQNLFDDSFPIEKLLLTGMKINLETLVLILKSTPLLKKIKYSEGSDFDPIKFQVIRAQYSDVKFVV